MKSFLVPAAGAGVALLVLGVGTMLAPRGVEQPSPALPAVQLQTVARELPAEPSVPAAEPAAPVISVAPITPIAPNAPIAPVAISPLPRGATAVPDEDLIKLSEMVGLADAHQEPPDKKQWSQALPIARALLDGPCDCEQRNWLRHFVEMGDAALSNASAAYIEHAELMTTLARNDAQLIAKAHKAE